MKRLASITALLIGLSLGALPAMAHPLGNFTTNLHLGLELLDSGLTRVALIVDMAEIPAFREVAAIDTNLDDSLDPAELDSYSVESCGGFIQAIELRSAGDRLELVPISWSATRRTGQGGLETMRIECQYETRRPATGVLGIRNGVYADRLGWAELVVAGDGSADGIPATSPSQLLTQYPGGAVMEVRQAEVHLGAGTPAAAAGLGGVPVTRFTERLGQALDRGASGGGLVLALLSALALGAIHALAPGHGKTLMAAYLVGRQGTRRQAAGLGLAVAVSHTLGVAVLGLVTTLASSGFRPEAVYPWLSTASATIVTGLGLAMLWRAVRRRSHTDHSHDHPHPHPHSHPHPSISPIDHHHPHEKIPGTGPGDGSLSWRSLAALGLAGGLVPSASAVVLLLGATSLGRPGLGLALVVAFGLGMSIALVGAGLLALRVTRAGLVRWRGRSWLRPRLIPALGGTMVTVVGITLLAGSIGQLV
jgi:ABC-type nickel/cobalt efflux system permease component RcnA